MARRPRVSVIVPVYNRESLIRLALESALRQSFTDFEILVVDDGSTDATVEVAHSYADPRIRVIQNSKNLGIPRTRNRGVDEARGEFIAWLDSDDIARGTRLAEQVAFLDAHPDVTVVGSFARWIDQGGKPMKIRRRPQGSDEIKARLLFSGCFTNTTVMARRAIQLAYRYREDFELGSDVELWTRIALDHEVVNLPQVLMDHRTHGGRAGGERGERSEIVRRNKARVITAQLEGLGVAFDSADLERHLLLRTSRSIPADTAFAAWAHDWLLRLRRANASRRLYPSAPFTRALGERWLLVCYRVGLARVAHRVLRSPLTPSGVAHFYRACRGALRQNADRRARAAA